MNFLYAFCSCFVDFAKMHILKLFPICNCQLTEFCLAQKVKVCAFSESYIDWRNCAFRPNEAVVLLVNFCLIQSGTHSWQCYWV